MVDIRATPTALQTGDAAVVNRAGNPAAIVLKDGATKAVGTTAADLAAGDRGLVPGGTTGYIPIWNGSAWVPGPAPSGGGGLTNLQSDPDPTLGADLDPNGHNILNLASLVVTAITALAPAERLAFANALLADLADEGDVITQSGAVVSVPFLNSGGVASRFFGFKADGTFWLPTYTETRAELFSAFNGVLISTAGVITAQTIYPNLPQNSKSAAYTLVLADANTHIYHPSADTTARTWTIPSNASVAFPIGTGVTFVNDTSGGVITIAITSDTLVLAGAGTTGSRTLAANGNATALKVTATRWIISGTGLT